MSDATVQTSALSGVWASVHPKRQALHATAAALVLDAWQDDAAALPLSNLVTRYRRDTAGLDREHRYQAALSLLLAALLAGTWLRTRTALALAGERAAEAGQAAAGEHTGTEPGTAVVPTGAGLGPVLSALLAATARRMGRQLADSTGSQQQQAAILRGTVRAGADLLTATDVLVSAAYGRGQQAGYQQRGVELVAWVTVGDGRVCPTCLGREDASPYPVASAPSMPAHANCRCTYTPA